MASAVYRNEHNFRAMHSTVIHIHWSALSSAAHLQLTLQLYHEDCKSMQDFHRQRRQWYRNVFSFRLSISCTPFLGKLEYIWNSDRHIPYLVKVLTNTEESIERESTIWWLTRTWCWLGTTVSSQPQVSVKDTVGVCHHKRKDRTNSQFKL